jgi:hypothetical protein
MAIVLHHRSQAPHRAGVFRAQPTLALTALTSTLSALGLLLAPQEAVAQEDKQLGAQFIDPPEAADAEPEASEVDQSTRPEYVPGYRLVPSIGLSPFSPLQFVSLPGGTTPAFGAPVNNKGYRFNFTGYLQQPVVMSIGKRPQAFEGQKQTTLHGDPVVAGGAWGYFDHTMTVPSPWTQLNFQYGNEDVQATAIIGAWGIGQSQYAAGYYMANSQVWASDAFLTYSPDVAPVGLSVRVGSYSDRYGAMSKWTAGAYGLTLMGELQGVGTTGTLSLPFENGVTFQLESGFKGDFSRPPSTTIPDNSNEYPLLSMGSTYGAHGHFTAGYQDIVVAGIHAIHTFSQDDRIDEVLPYDEYTTQPYPKDGSIDLYGVDLRVDAARFGYLYAGVSKLTGENALSVNGLLKFMHTGNGKDLSERYWGFGANGNGSVTIIGAQYTLSLGTLLRHPMEFWGDGPDLLISVFGLQGSVGTEAPDYDGSLTYDGHKMFKWGTETTYVMTKWLAASVRTDHVMPDLNDSSRAFGVISPKLTFRTDWQSRETLNLQYAGYVLGSGTRVEGDRRLQNTPFGKSDEHLFAIFGTIWW